jgi:hypothetical protein
MPEANQTSNDSLNDDEFDKAFNAAAAAHGVAETKPFVPDQEGDGDDDDSDTDAMARQAAATDAATTEQPTLDKELAATKARLAAAEHSARSNAGRVAALQRKLDEEQKAARTKQAGGEAPGSESDIDDNSFGEEYSEVANFVERAVEKRVGPIVEAERQRNEQVQIQQETARIASAYELVAAAHPDFDQIRSNPEFGPWLKTQAPMIAAMAGSEDPADAIALCDIYKASKGEKRTTSRRDLIGAAEEIPSRGGSRKAGVPDDFDAAFDHFKSQKLSNAQR